MKKTAAAALVLLGALLAGCSKTETPAPAAATPAPAAVTKIVVGLDDLQAATARADQALYASKDNGRNRITLAEDQ